MKDDSAYLEHIREAIRKIEAYVAGGRERFLAESIVQDAVVRNLEIIGEASRHLSQDLRDRHPEIPWRSVMALRNVLIHEYFGVDLDIVWKVVRRRLPQLKATIQALLRKGRP